MIARAVVKDGKAIQELIKIYSDKGLMLFRPISEVYENIRDFTVFKEGEQVLGVASLHIDWVDLAEVRSLAVLPEKEGRGIGGALVKACLEEAKTMGIDKVFTLTYVPDFFKKQGFEIVDKSEFPHKVWGDCVNCAKFPECDETALIYRLGKGFGL